MQCYGIVELGLGEPRLHRDRGGLQDFRRVGADHVDADHHVGLRMDDQLVERALVAVRSEAHTSELQSLMRISYAVFCLKKKKPKLFHALAKCRTHRLRQPRIQLMIKTIS